MLVGSEPLGFVCTSWRDIYTYICTYRRRTLTTDEVLDVIKNIEDIRNFPHGIVIRPPDDFSDNTDYDSRGKESSNPD